MMNSENLMDCIGQIDDRIILEADMPSVKKQPVRRPRIMRVSIAAAVCLVVAVPFIISQKPSTDFSGLPKLAAATEFEAFGFEGYLAHNIGELENGNPWTADTNLSVLPVFTNPTQYDGAGKPIQGLSADKMIVKANETAAVLGLAVDKVFTNPTEEDLRKQREKERSIPGNEEYEPDATPYEAVAICGDITIEIDASGNVTLLFANGISLPEEYNFTHYGSTEQQARAATEYLLDLYAPVAAMKSPALALFGDYTFNAQRLFSYSAYENNGDITERVLGYNFNRIVFSPNDNGDLWIIRRSSDNLLSQKIGDYPIITVKEAHKLLLEKHYITTVPEELPGEEYIARVELIYRTGRGDQVFMPYYKFLVELPAMQRENGLKTFGVFYVPAVKGEFLENMPLWDGSFN